VDTPIPEITAAAAMPAAVMAAEAGTVELATVVAVGTDRTPEAGRLISLNAFL
jgi:hypothetical protein